MNTPLECPKCQTTLHHHKTSKGIDFQSCPKCNGVLIDRSDLVKTFNKNVYVEQLVKIGLQKSYKTDQNCPSCPELLLSGKVFDSSLTLEECIPCEHFYFDNNELSKLFQIIDKESNYTDKEIDLKTSKVIETDKDCPVCENTKLFQVKGHNNVAACVQCGGISTQVETLERFINKSLFAPTMFTERDGQGAFAMCRHCHHAQSTKNTECQKCHKKLHRIHCLSCNARMNEYDLNEVIIERCQFCNELWLDNGEFEKILNILPDVKRHYERMKRKAELTSAAVRGASVGIGVAMDVTRRKIMDRTGLIYKLLFINSY